MCGHLKNPIQTNLTACENEKVGVEFPNNRNGAWDGRISARLLRWRHFRLRRAWPILGQFFGFEQLGRVVSKTTSVHATPCKHTGFATYRNLMLLDKTPAFTTHNRLVTGSNPVGSTILTRIGQTCLGNSWPILGPRSGEFWNGTPDGG